MVRLRHANRTPRSNRHSPNPGDVIFPGPNGLPAPIGNQHTYYFNRKDVKEAIHAPLDIQWSAGGNVFKGGPLVGPEGEGDLSPDPIQHVLPQVINATNNVIVTNGNLDGLILTDGTLLSIQNMTWNGKLGMPSHFVVSAACESGLHNCKAFNMNQPRLSSRR